MSALVRPGDAAPVRDFGSLAYATRPVSAQPAIDPRDAERAALRREVDRLAKALADADAASEVAASKAREEGRAAGLAEATRREDDRLSALGSALAHATAAFDERLDVLEGLAPALVRACLDKLFDRPERWSEMSEAMLARQLRQLRRASLVSITVSAEDFADPSAISGLAPGNSQIGIDPELRAGACRITCKLGQFDLDVRQQWSAISRLLESMAAA